MDIKRNPSPGKPTCSSLTRRAFLGRSLATGAALGFGTRSHAHADWIDATLPPDHGFTIVGIPDLHLDFRCTVDNLATISQWLVARAQQLNIRFVAQLGDAGDRRGSGTIGDMLAACRRGFAPLAEAGIPVSVCMGNHDYDRPSALRANSQWMAETAFGTSFYRNMHGFGDTGSLHDVIAPAGYQGHEPDPAEEAARNLDREAFLASHPPRHRTAILVLVSGGTMREAGRRCGLKDSAAKKQAGAPPGHEKFGAAGVQPSNVPPSVRRPAELRLRRLSGGSFIRLPATRDRADPARRWSDRNPCRCAKPRSFGRPGE